MRPNYPLIPMVTILCFFLKKFIIIMLHIRNSWKRCPEINKVRNIGGFSSKFCFKGSKVSQILRILKQEKRLKCTKR